MPAAQAARIAPFFVEIWNGGNLARIDDLFAPAFLGCVFPDLGGPTLSRARLKECVLHVRSALPDWHISILHQVGLDTVVVTQWRGAGTLRGMLLGQPPHGQAVHVTGMSITRLAAGQITEHWDHWSRRALLRQLAAD
jgi:predicted ester cyclase